MHPMNDEESLHLQDIVTGGLMRKVVPPHVEQSLVKQGLVRKAIGGLMVTEIGHKMFMELKKK